jgi:hypothetical protein
MSTLRRRTIRAIAVLLAAIAVGGVTLVTASPASAATVRDSIVTTATNQLGGLGCSPGYNNSCGINWCAEFARWVWSHSAVTDVAGLDSWAQSFKTYGTNRGLYHSRTSGYVPQPGDAVVFDWDHDPADDHPIDHVAIVTSVTSSQVNTIGGNQGGTTVYDSSVSRASYARSSTSIDGYVEPAGAGSGASTGYRVVSGDVTGDGRAELIGRRSDGTLWLYLNGGNNSAPYGSGTQIGVSWQQFTSIVSGDVTGDARADMVAVKPDGTLWLYVNGGNDSAPYSTGTQIGAGWQQFRSVALADVTGDARADIVAVKPDGTLWLYVNGGNNSAPYGSGIQIGVSWQQFTSIVSADVTGDARADMVAVKPDGTLWLYTNGGNNSAPYSTGTQIGSGWQQFTTIVSGDVTGDARADVVAIKPDGTLWLYTNGGNNSAPYSTGTQIGSGWQIFA